MARTYSLITVLLCLSLLAGCTKPVTYYASHADERQARVKVCLRTPENDNHDCRNAAQAEFDAMGIKAINGRAIVQMSNSR
jgi:porphobilinogen deaminase